MLKFSHTIDSYVTWTWVWLVFAHTMRKLDNLRIHQLADCQLVDWSACKLSRGLDSLWTCLQQ